MSRTKKLCLSAILAAAALILFIVEAQFPSLTSIPGIKLGLSNIVTVFALYSLGPLLALGVLLTRVILGALVTGQVAALIYSLAGGLLAFALAALLRPRIPAGQLWVVSVLSALAHNAGQLFAAILVTATPAILAYAPLLVLSALFTGLFTGLCAQLVLKRLCRLGLVSLYHS